MLTHDNYLSRLRRQLYALGLKAPFGMSTALSGMLVHGRDSPQTSISHVMHEVYFNFEGNGMFAIAVQVPDC